MMHLRSSLLTALVALVAPTATFTSAVHGRPSLPRRLPAARMVLGFPSPASASPLDLFSGRGARPETLYENGTPVDFLLESLHLTKRRVSGGILVRAPPEALWAVLTDYEHMPEVVPNILSNRVTRDERTRRVTIQQESLLSNKLQLRVDMELEAIEQRDQWKMQLRRLSGHGFLDFTAEYELKPRADGTTYLSYAVELVPCPIFPLPLVERKVRKEVPKMLYAVGAAAQKRRSRAL